MHEHEDNWQAFRNSLTFQSEKRLGVIPVLGTGFNRHLLTDLVYPDGLVDWRELLRGVARGAGVGLPDMAPDGQALISAWESMVLQYRSILAAERKTTVQASDAEAALQREVCAWIRVQTNRLRIDVQEPAASFLGRFQDVLNLNFDDLLLPQADAAVGGTGWSPMCRVGGSRVWHPHGTVLRPASLKLGVRRYGMGIHRLELARGRFKKEERKRRPAARNDCEANAHRAADLTCPDWLAAAINAPLLLFGVGLGPDEWLMWWFLHNRARNHAGLKLDRVPPVFRLTCDADSQSAGARAWRSHSAVRFIDLHGGKDWTAAWDKLSGMLDTATTLPAHAQPIGSALDAAKVTEVRHAVS